MKENKEIKEHFTVPEGYFAKLHDDIMDRIGNMPVVDAEDVAGKRTFAVAFRRMAVAAAVAAVVILSGTVIWGGLDNSVAENIVADTVAASEESLALDAKDAGSEVVAVRPEVVAAVSAHEPRPKHTARSVNRVKAKDIVTPQAEPATEDVEDMLMIDGQMMHQMLLSEM